MSGPFGGFIFWRIFDFRKIKSVISDVALCVVCMQVQCCVLASTLLCRMFSVMLTDAFQDGDNGILIRYRFDGKLFNLRRLQAKSKVQTEVLDVPLCWWHDEGCSNRRKDAKTVLIKYLFHVTAMISQSASKGLRWYISQYLESLTRSLPSQWKVNDCKW